MLRNETAPIVLIGNKWNWVNIPENILYSVTASDRCSNVSIVGAIEIKDDKLKLCSLSYRALSRSFENNMFEFLDKNVVSGFDFKATSKNDEMYFILIQKYFRH